MERISNNFINSLRNHKSPNKSKQNSHHKNTPSPYAKQTPNANSNKKISTSQLGSQSQQVAKQINRNSVTNISLNKSISPSINDAQAFGIERNIQLQNNNQQGQENDYKKIINIKNIINVTQTQNYQGQLKNEFFFQESQPNSQQQYYSFIPKLEQGKKQNTGILRESQMNKQNLNSQNNIFDSSNNNENAFFNNYNIIKPNYNERAIQQTQIMAESQNFFRKSQSSENQIQEGQNKISMNMEDEKRNSKKLSNSFFIQGEKQQIQQNIQPNSLQTSFQQNDSPQKINKAKIYSLRGSVTNLNTSTELGYKDRIQNNGQKIMDIGSIIQKTQRNSSIQIPFRDIRQRHKQLKLEQGDSFLSIQKSVLDEIKDINKRRKLNTKKQSEQGIQQSDNNERQSQDINNISITRSEVIQNTTINNTLQSNNGQLTNIDDSLMNNLNEVWNQEDDDKISQRSNQSENINQHRSKKQHKEFVFNGRYKNNISKLDMIQEQNTSKNSLVSGGFYQSTQNSLKNNIFEQTDSKQNNNKNSQNDQNRNMFSSQISDIFVNQKNLFGKHSFQEEDDEFLQDNLYSEDKSKLNQIDTHLFENSYESVSNNFSNNRKMIPQTLNKLMSDISGFVDEKDNYTGLKQNMANSILDRAFIEEVASANKDETSIRCFQDLRNCETTIASQNGKQFSSDIFTNNQDSLSFNQDNHSLKRLDQMGFQDISPIQSQIYVKIFNSGSKKEKSNNNQELLEDIFQRNIPKNNIYQSNESNISEFQIFDSYSNDICKNSTIPIKRLEIIQSQSDNVNIHCSQSQSNKVQNYSTSQNAENQLKEEIQTPIIQQKLQQFLEDVGYYTNQQKKEEINEIMAKITLGIVIDKTNNQKQSLDFDIKNIDDNELKIKRQSIAQSSDKKSCTSRISINLPHSEDNSYQSEYQVTDQNNQSALKQIEQLKDNQSKLNQEKSHEDNDQELIESKHFEVLKREVEFLYSMCKGENTVEKQISQKILNDVLCPKFGKKTLQEALKQAIKKSRSIRVSASNKNKIENSIVEQSIVSKEVIIEKQDDNNCNNKSKQVVISTDLNDLQNQQKTENQPSKDNLKRKGPTKGNTRKRTQTSKSQATKIQQSKSKSIDSSFSSSFSLNKSDSEQVLSDISEDQNDNKKVKKKQNKKLKK